MTEDVQGRQSAAPARSGGPARKRLWLFLIAVAILLVAVLVVPPMVSIARYKGRITRLISDSLGRPVRLSSVELRLLPRPGFVLTNLSVAEDPAYGAEPVLHAATVTASIRLLPLWRGRLEIGSISVDDASLNLVRNGPGRWNLDPLFRTAAAKAGASSQPVPLPGLEATNSRINIKNGAEKLPFSLVNTDLEFWQESSGEWRIRLRGQPARTDVSLYQEDTGVVRLEATLRRASALSEMPVHLDLDWREAQLGQLARLITGADPGWRGDLTGEMHLDGTANAARIATRLQATGVHRAEFSPAEPMDFDANCALLYHYSRRALENLVCDSPLGGGRIHFTGNVPGENAPSHFSVELDRVPVAAGLDALRTLRSGLAADLEARGAVSGKIDYAGDATPPLPMPKPARPGRNRSSSPASQAPSPLAGSLVVEGFELSGAGLNSPIQIPRTVFEPVPASPAPSNSAALTGTASIPAGGPAPLVFTFLLAPSGYQVAIHGPASLARAREVFTAAGLANSSGLDGFAGDPLLIDLTAGGPWLAREEIPPPSPLPAAGEPSAPPVPQTARSADTFSGTVTVRSANWKADFLANHVEISQATLHLGIGEIRWDPVVFSYGPVKGTASLAVPVDCVAPDICNPHFQIHFGNLDAAVLQTAALGQQEKSTLLSSLIDRLHPSSAPPWPRLEGDVSADSLVLGPSTLRNLSMTLHIAATGAEITSLQAEMLGGSLQATGSFDRATSDQDKPAYDFECKFANLNAQAVGQLIGQRWSGGTIQAEGKISLAGYTDVDLSASAKGSLHFEWRHGTVSTKATDDLPAIPAPLAHFDLWTADTAIGDGAIALGQNTVQAGSRSRSVEGKLTFADPPRVEFAAPKPASPQQ